MKMLSFVMSCVIALTSCMISTGCSQNQFDQNVATALVQLGNLQNTVDSIAALTNDAQLKAVMDKVVAAANADLPVVKAAGDAYLSNKSKGNKTALIAAATALQASITPLVIQANGVKNAGSEKTALTALAIFAIGVSGISIALGVSGGVTSAQADTILNYQTIRAYVPREEEVKIAAMYGYTLDQIGL